MNLTLTDEDIKKTQDVVKEKTIIAALKYL